MGGVGFILGPELFTLPASSTLILHPVHPFYSPMTMSDRLHSDLLGLETRSYGCFYI